MVRYRGGQDTRVDVQLRSRKTCPWENGAPKPIRNGLWCQFSGRGLRRQTISVIASIGKRGRTVGLKTGQITGFVAADDEKNLEMIAWWRRIWAARVPKPREDPLDRPLIAWRPAALLLGRTPRKSFCSIELETVRYMPGFRSNGLADGPWKGWKSCRSQMCDLSWPAIFCFGKVAIGKMIWFHGCD